MDLRGASGANNFWFGSKLNGNRWAKWTYSIGLRAPVTTTWWTIIAGQQTRCFRLLTHHSHFPTPEKLVRVAFPPRKVDGIEFLTGSLCHNFAQPRLASPISYSPVWARCSPTWTISWMASHCKVISATRRHTVSILFVLNRTKCFCFYPKLMRRMAVVTIELCLNPQNWSIRICHHDWHRCLKKAQTTWYSVPMYTISPQLWVSFVTSGGFRSTKLEKCSNEFNSQKRSQWTRQ